MKNPLEQQKVSVTERQLLLAPGQSKKLAALRNRFQADIPLETLLLPERQRLPGFKTELEIELLKAQRLIDKRINEIMCSFPEGKKNKLFGFRYDSVDALKTMPINTACKILNLDDSDIKMKLLAEFDYYGNQLKGY